jgi:hypothetical protein
VRAKHLVWRLIGHTFGTYSVHQVFGGTYEDPTLTLHVGGGEVPGTGEWPRIHGFPDMPLFDRGHREIVFVKNAESRCPLVACDSGRIRIIGDIPLTHDGYFFVEDEKGHLVQGEESPGKVTRVLS